MLKFCGNQISYPSPFAFFPTGSIMRVRAMQTLLVLVVLLPFPGSFDSRFCMGRAAGGGGTTRATAASDRNSIPSSPFSPTDERVYEVHKKVRDFPEGEDLSTPEAAFASILRAWVAQGDNGPFWLRLSSPQTVSRLTRLGFRSEVKKELAKEKAEPILNADVLEVHILDQTHAAVIARLPREGHDLHLCWFERLDGRWLNEGSDSADTIEQAREKIATTVAAPPPAFSWTRPCRRFLIENMSNSVVLCFGDGTAFFVGVVAVVFSLLLLVRFRTRPAAAGLIAVALIGVVVVVSSATPLPAWTYVLWLLSVTATLVLCVWRSPLKARIVSAGVLFAISTGICAAEIPYHLFPRLSVGPRETVYVVGDSLSAGVEKDRTGRHCPELRCWPAVLADMTQLNVVNLAKPGAKVHSAAAQAKLAKQPNSIVILEVGGNDFFSDVTVFRRQLDTLLSSLDDHRAILMFELPLFPFQNAFGRAQRELAAKHGVILIPKRCLTSIWGSSGGTLDGVHFSQTGHETLARRVAGVLDVEDDTAPF